MNPRPLLIGTYTTGRASEGLYLCELDVEGVVRIIRCLKLRDPSFLVLHPHLGLAYVLGEHPTDLGCVTTVSIDRASGKLDVETTVSAAGHLPCHAAITRDGAQLWIANYGSGSVAVFGLDSSGAFAGTPQVFLHEGRSEHPRRQASPHPHCVAIHPNGRDIHVTDLGTDRIEHYRIGADSIVRLAGTAVDAGAGPRSLLFTQDGRGALLSNEIDNTLTVSDVGFDGVLELRYRVSTLPHDYRGRSATSAVAIHPSGRMIYVGNRGHDSIACFGLTAVDGEPRGAPVIVAHVPSRGAHPRHFALSPEDDRLLIANRDSDNLVSYAVDRLTGVVDSRAAISSVPAPAFVCWL